MHQETGEQVWEYDEVIRRTRGGGYEQQDSSYYSSQSGGYGGGPYRVGGGVSAPKLLFGPDPEFSDEARRAKFQGTCVVSVVVDENGRTQHARIIGHLGMGLDEKALEAVKQYRFIPAKLAGKPVQAWLDGDALRFARLGE